MGSGRSNLSKTSNSDAWSKAGVNKMDVDVSKFKVYRNNMEVDRDHWDATNTFMQYAKTNRLASSIEAYTGDDYIDMNRLSRDTKYKDMSTEDMIKDLRARGEDPITIKHIVNVNKALNQGEVPVPFVAFRGSDSTLLTGKVGSSFKEMKAMEGEIVRDTGNMSTSMVMGKEFNWKPVIYTVYFPAGKGIGANIMGFSQYGSSEGEFLANNGAMYQVMKVKQRNGKIEVTMAWVGRY